MENRWYVFKITIGSSGTEDRNLTPYDDHDTAIRKYHEAFNSVGAGPKFIAATILDRYMNQDGSHTETWSEEEAPAVTE